MTEQEVYDAALFGIRKQGEPSITKTSYGTAKCVYRFHTPDGRVLKCGIGQSLPDELYQPAMDANGVATDTGIKASRLEKAYPEVALFYEPCRPLLLDVVQEAHDEAAVQAEKTGKPFLPLFETNMESLHSYGVTYTPPQATPT